MAKADIKLLNFAVTRFLIKLFRTTNIDDIRGLCLRSSCHRYVVRVVATAENETKIDWVSANGATSGSAVKLRGEFKQIYHNRATDAMRVQCDKPCLVMLYNTGSVYCILLSNSSIHLYFHSIAITRNVTVAMLCNLRPHDAKPVIFPNLRRSCQVLSRSTYQLLSYSVFYC